MQEGMRSSFQANAREGSFLQRLLQQEKEILISLKKPKTYIYFFILFHKVYNPFQHSCSMKEAMIVAIAIVFLLIAVPGCTFQNPSASESTESSSCVPGSAKCVQGCAQGIEETCSGIGIKKCDCSNPFNQGEISVPSSFD